MLVACLESNKKIQNEIRIIIHNQFKNVLMTFVEFLKSNQNNACGC